MNYILPCSSLNGKCRISCVKKSTIKKFGTTSACMIICVAKGILYLDTPKYPKVIIFAT